MRDHPLKSYRIVAKLTQRQLAALLGVERTTIARWEIGARKIDQALLPVITGKTGLSASVLRPDLAQLMNESAA